MSVAAIATGPVFDHLHHLTDGRGLFEHALHREPRPEHGYCVDDVARALVVVCREQRPTPELKLLARHYLDFTLSALESGGLCHNRMSTEGVWNDDASLGDWWGRAVWGLGFAASQAPTQAMRANALLGFRTAARVRSPHRRAMAFAALGAGELLRQRPDEPCARVLLRDAVTAVDAVTGIGAYDPESDWPWPEPRLTYANGAVAEALLVAGHVLADPGVQDRGLRLLRFLLLMETRDGHLSLTPVGGRGPGESGPAFDQQPIEAATLADACVRAYEVTGDPRWLEGVRKAWAWFVGDNDSGTLMFDPATGGGFDGLLRDGHNLNQGAESTLALLSTAQHAKRLDLVG